MANAPEYCDWEERLQERIDGELDPPQSAVLDAHIAGCSACHTRMRALQALDAALWESLPRPAPADGFDNKVLQRVAAAERADRAAARTRIEQEWQSQLAVLSRQWRGIWGSVVLNMLAGSSLLIVFSKTLEGAPLGTHWADQVGAGVGFLTEYIAIRPETVVATAMGLALVLLWLVRFIVLTRRAVD